MDANLVESVGTLFTIFGLIAMLSMLISFWQDNKTFVVVRVTLNAFVVILGVMSGKDWLAVIWAFTTVLSLVNLARMNGKPDNK